MADSASEIEQEAAVAASTPRVLQAEDGEDSTVIGTASLLFDSMPSPALTPMTPVTPLTPMPPLPLAPVDSLSPSPPPPAADVQVSDVAVLDDDEDLAASLAYTHTRVRGSQVHDRAPGVSVDSSPVVSSKRSSESDPAMPAITLDPTHTVRTRLMDESHPHCRLGSPQSVLHAAAPSASMLGVFEILVHFHEFKNIDLFRQGLYFLRATVFTIAAERKADVAANGANGTGSGASHGVGVGAGAHGDQPRGDEAVYHSGQHGSSLHAQILAWEADVHALNLPLTKEEKAKQGTEAAAPRTSEGLLAASEGAMRLRKHKLALPYSILQTPSDGDNGEEIDAADALFAFADKAVYPASIQDRTNQFHSRTFRVQYMEQEIVLNDACLFRLELNLRRATPVYLEVELMFSEYTIADVARGRPPPREDEFVTASRHLYCMDDIYTRGVHAFVPLFFDDQHFSSVDTVVHTQLIDFKFRPSARQPHSQPPVDVTRSGTRITPDVSAASSSPASSPSSLGRGSAASSQLPSASPTSPSSAGAVFSRPTFPTHSLAQILFPRLMHPNPHRASSSAHIQTNPASVMQLANDHHQLLLTTLIRAYNQLAGAFFIYNRHCVSGMQRATMATALHVPQLVLPEGVSPDDVNGSPSRNSASAFTSSETEGSRQRGASMTKTSRSSSSAQAWTDEPSASSSSSIAPPSPSVVPTSPTSRARRSSMDAHAHELERLQSDPSDLEAIRAAFPLPPLYTLAYRLRHEGACCAWEQPDCAATMILGDLQSVSQQIFTLWHRFQQALPLCIGEVVKLEKKRWTKASTARWSNFIFRESYHIEDRWRVGHANIGEIHGRTVNQLRASGALSRLCPASLVRDCAPSLQAHEQVLLFEERFLNHNDSAQAAVIDQADGFEIIDSHFHESEGSSSSSASAASSSVSSADKPVLSVAAEQSIAQAGVLSDSVAGSASPSTRDALMAEVPRERQSSTVSTDPRGLVAPLPAEPGVTSSSLSGTSPSSFAVAAAIDFEAVSRRISAASHARRVSLAHRPYEGKHLIVLCHGYQGSSWDMRLLKNHITLMYPSAQVYAATSNEQQTEGDIASMGKRLAVELDQYLSESCKDLGRLSFVCHSLGGLIVRSALCEPELIPYLSKLHTYLSLATPHCGYLFSDNSMLTTGIWFLKRWNRSACLSQLSLSDADDPQDCFLYQLAKKPSLAHFKHVFLLASQQDKYAPFHSARIEIHPAALAERKKGVIYNNMVSSLLGSLTRDDVHLRRGDLWYRPMKRNIDSFIGRTAHINFLTSSNYWILMLQTFGDELFS